jgi:AdoMet-dependent heme synthase
MNKSQKFIGPFTYQPAAVCWELSRANSLACTPSRNAVQSPLNSSEVTTYEALQVIDDLADLKPLTLTLEGDDPMSRRDLLEIATYAAAAGMQIKLRSLATQRLIQSDFHAIRAAGIDKIVLNLDGATRETHDSFYNSPGSFDRTLQAIKLARDAGVSVQVTTTLRDSNLHEFPVFRSLMFEWMPDVWSVSIFVPNGDSRTEEIPKPESLEKIFEEMIDLIGSAPFAIQTEEGYHFRRLLAQHCKSVPTARSCIRDGRGMICITHTGDICPSKLLPQVCGNIRYVSPKLIYREHSLFVSLRDSDALGGKCGRCEYREICGGSRSRAYAATGDPFAEDPACAYQPRITARHSLDVVSAPQVQLSKLNRSDSEFCSEWNYYCHSEDLRAKEKHWLSLRS